MRCSIEFGIHEINCIHLKRKGESMSVNLNNIAKEVTESEGLKESISIAQTKEVMRIIFTDYYLETLIKMYFKYNKIK